MSTPIKRLIASNLLLGNEALVFDLHGLEGSVRDLPELAALSLVVTPEGQDQKAKAAADGAIWSDLQRLQDAKLGDYRLWRFVFRRATSRTAPVAQASAPGHVWGPGPWFWAGAGGIVVGAQLLGECGAGARGGPLAAAQDSLYLLSRLPTTELTAATTLCGLGEAAFARERPQPLVAQGGPDWRDLALLVCPSGDFLIRPEAGTDPPRSGLHLMMTRRMLASLISPGPFRPDPPAEQPGN